MSGIKVTWDIGTFNPEKHYIYRSDYPISPDNLPTPLAEVGQGINEYTDLSIVDGETYHYFVAAEKMGLLVPADSSIEVEAASFKFGPGSETLIAGDMTDGFFGEVSSTELFTGDELASSIGLTAGVSQFSNEPWLKFAIDEKIVYIAKKPYRHTVSWNDINAANAVYASQNTIVTKGTDNFLVRLPTGGHADPVTRNVTLANSNAGEGSEWNRLMYRVHVDVPDGTPTYDGGPQIGANWAEYTNADLVSGSGNGRACWTQEASSNNRVYRGDTNISRMNSVSSTFANTAFGWRPVLELQS